MREPILVDYAALAPFCCALCTNTTGPFSDTFFEDLAGRKYLCKRCAKTNARLHGFAPGKKLDELEAVTVTVEAKDAEIASLLAQLRELQAGARSESEKLRDIRAELERALDRERSRQHLADTLVETALQLAELGEQVAA